uniref:Uncharacterized protein n=1 Tax=viral metagenome TaxID=1070528 RepID=A0A6H1ZMP4_9ZZZZ
MPYDRIIQYNIESGNLLANSVGSLSYYTEHAIRGRLYKIAALTNASGTTTLTESGTNETLFAGLISSGTKHSIFYPRIPVCTTAGVAVTSASGNLWELPATNNYLQLQHTAGSNLGFQNIKIYYR